MSTQTRKSLEYLANRMEEIAAEGRDGDTEALHGEADRLLVEALVFVGENDPTVARICAAWIVGSDSWWCA